MNKAALNGRTVIVTGSSRRIGKEIVLSFARSGASVVVNGRTDDGAVEAVAHEVRAFGGAAVACVADVSTPEGAVRLTEAALRTFGGVDVLINNAAIRPSNPFEKISADEWRQVLAVTLDASFFMAQACSQALRSSDAGRIINIGGASGHKAMKNRAHVSAAKAGLVGLTRALAVEFGSSATVNCVVPGMIEDISDSSTEQKVREGRVPVDALLTPRRGLPSDVAGLALFLASDAGAYITGQCLHVSGGLVIP